MCTTVDRSFEVSANTGNIACLGLTCNREGKPGDLILMSKSARNEIQTYQAELFCSCSDFLCFSVSRTTVATLLHCSRGFPC